MSISVDLSPVRFDFEVITTREGGMGRVFFCRNLESNRPAALKSFKPEYLPDRATRDRFLRECDTWITIGSHPHIVRAHRVHSSGTSPAVFIELDWIPTPEGKRDASLRAWLVPDLPLPLDQVLTFALHMARGMRHATSCIPGLVHCDLKPENVLVGRDGNARITDFGLVHVLANSGLPLPDSSAAPAASLGRTQRTRGVAGTPLYMAPEQWVAGHPLDARTDIYALGCILAELLLGRPAVSGAGLTELEQAHQAGQVAALPASVPPALAQVVRRCMAVAPEGRYADWPAVEAALAAAYQEVLGQPAPAPPAAVATSQEERIAAAWSYLAIGQGYGDIGKPAIAASYGEQALAVARATHDRSLEEASLDLMSSMELAQSHFHPGIVLTNEALEINRTYADGSAESHYYGRMGQAYYGLGDFDKAISFYKQALSSAGEHDLTTRSQTLQNLGVVYAGIQNYQAAIDCLEESQAYFKRLNAWSAVAMNYGTLGQVYRRTGDPQRGLEYSQQALALFRQLGDHTAEGRELSFQGHTYAAIGNMEQAARCWSESMQIAEEVGEQVVVGTNAMALAKYHLIQGNLERAVAFAQRAHATYQAIGRTAWAADAARLIHTIQTAQHNSQQPELSGAFTEMLVHTINRMLNAESPTQVRQIVTESPFLLKPSIISSIEEAIATQLPPALRPAAKQRLATLKQIAQELRSG